MNTAATISLKPTTITYLPPDAAAMQKRARAALSMASSFTIETAADYEVAVDELRIIKGRREAFEAQRVAITKPINDGVKLVNDLFRQPIADHDEAEKIIKRAMLAYTTKVELEVRLAREAEERRVAEEKKRLEDEAAALRAAAAAAQPDPATGELSPEALAAQRAAEEQADAAQLAAAVMTPTAAVGSPRKVAGVSTAKTWEGEVTDKLALMAYVVSVAAEQPELVALFNVDTIVLKKQVLAKGEHLKLPGVTVTQKGTVRIR